MQSFSEWVSQRNINEVAVGSSKFVAHFSGRPSQEYPLTVGQVTQAHIDGAVSADFANHKGISIDKMYKIAKNLGPAEEHPDGFDLWYDDPKEQREKEAEAAEDMEDSFISSISRKSNARLAARARAARN